MTDDRQLSCMIGIDVYPCDRAERDGRRRASARRSNGTMIRSRVMQHDRRIIDAVQEEGVRRSVSPLLLRPRPAFDLLSIWEIWTRVV